MPLFGRSSKKKIAQQKAAQQRALVAAQQRARLAAAARLAADQPTAPSQGQNNSERCQYVLPGREGGWKVVSVKHSCFSFS